MSTIYLLTLIGVLAVIGTLMLDAVTSVSRKPKWASSEARSLTDLSMERRRLKLAFVGAERRNAIIETDKSLAEPSRIAA
jgi:hypothetical protein